VVCAGEGEVGLDVGGDDLGGEAIEPRAFRVAKEPGGHGGLLRGTAARGSRKRRFLRTVKLLRRVHETLLEPDSR
jgi:hypothetical protein